MSTGIKLVENRLINNATSISSVVLGFLRPGGAMVPSPTGNFSPKVHKREDPVEDGNLGAVTGL